MEGSPLGDLLCGTASYQGETLGAFGYVFFVDFGLQIYEIVRILVFYKSYFYLSYSAFYKFIIFVTLQIQRKKCFFKTL